MSEENKNDLDQPYQSWKPRTRGGDSLQGKILEAARKVLLNNGIEKLSMRRIAGEIGCQAASIYYHYENKNALIHALIDEGHRLLYQELLNAVEESAGPLENLETNMRVFIRFCLDNPLYYEIMYLLRSSEVESYPKELYRKARRAGEPGLNLLAEAEEQGLIGPEDNAVRGAATRLMLHGYVAMILTSRLDKRLNNERLLDHLIDRIFLGLGIGGTRGQRFPLKISPS